VGTRTPGSRGRASWAGRRSASRLPSNLARPGQRGGGPAYLSPARRRRKPRQLATRALPGHCAGIPGQCPRRRPSGEVGCPGKAGWPSTRDGSRPGSGQAATVPLVTVASRPGSLQPGLSPGCGAQLTGIGGRAYHSPCPSRVPAVYLSWTWPRNSRQAANLTRTRRALPARGRDRDAARRSQVTARSARGQCQAGGRSAGGRPGVHRRPAPGRWWLAAWASAPVRYP